MRVFTFKLLYFVGAINAFLDFSFSHAVYGAGSRIADSCDIGSTYYSSIDSCVPQSISSLALFVSAFSFMRTCASVSVYTVADLEALRYCNLITGDLAIFVSDSTADFSSLHDIITIQGLYLLIYRLYLTACLELSCVYMKRSECS